ncbi:histidine kinase transcriptional regulator protein [Taibaiella lutea]|uniref:Histidine kinase transcriptional regulator protein n=1 Tax=Taibaiella lutea TaxID=2608001 RepID=A0A5M6CKN7_9BACT|nr:histidine kinase [Taibaiella lutea]KAA5533699.1 histidine kinase transcriptional regulator protein [Taibaiella lutea]
MSQQINLVFFILFGIAILLVATMIGLFLVFSRKKNQIIEAGLKKELELKIHQYEVELKALRSQMNPHFVHNSLNAIQYYIQRNEVEISENYLVKFSKLIRLFFEYSGKQNITIQQEIELLQNYLYLEKLRFEAKLNYEFHIDERLDIECQQIPSMLLQPIVENAVNHGIFHKEEEGNISVSFVYLDHQSFVVTIEDDGIGMTRSKAILKNNSNGHQHRSSNVIRDRIELLNQSKSWEITFDTHEKMPEQGSGTTITISFSQKN